MKNSQNIPEEPDFSGVGAPVHWYFRVWGTNFAKVPRGKHGEQLEYEMVQR
jgi:hypothetical protein